jgi:hypothetical protein
MASQTRYLHYCSLVVLSNISRRDADNAASAIAKPGRLFGEQWRKDDSYYYLWCLAIDNFVIIIIIIIIIIITSNNNINNNNNNDNSQHALIVAI